MTKSVTWEMKSPPLAAVDEDTAQEALSLIKVDYEELPAVFDMFEAMKEGAPQIHDEFPGNLTPRSIRSSATPTRRLPDAIS